MKWRPLTSEDIVAVQNVAGHCCSKCCCMKRFRLECYDELKFATSDSEREDLTPRAKRAAIASFQASPRSLLAQRFNQMKQ